MKDYILDIIHLNNDFTGNGMFMALYFVTLLFIFFYLNDRRLKEKILYPQAVLLVGIYLLFPAVNRFVVSFYDDEVRGRFAWLFMVPAIAAIGCTLMVSSLKEKKDQAALCIVLVPVIFLCGVFQITDYRFQKAENQYKLPQVYIDISDAVLKEQREKGDGIAKLIVPYEAAYAFRQYSSDIELLYGEDATYGRIWDSSQAAVDGVWTCRQLQTSCPNLVIVSLSAQNHGMEYLLLDCSYIDFGLESINVDGYTEDENFVGDRTPDPQSLEQMPETISIDKEKNCWDLGEYGLEYVGTYERYLLYRFREYKSFDGYEFY